MQPKSPTKSKPKPCTCGSKDKCEPRSPLVRTYAETEDPTTHWYGLLQTHGEAGLAKAIGSTLEWRLWSCIKLTQRDGLQSPWPAEYWELVTRHGLR